jgi:hypothetical protein
VKQHPVFWAHDLCVDTSFPFSVKPCAAAVTCNANFPFIQFGVELRGQGLECDPGL